MGGSVSAGRNNDELIDHLVEAEFIRTPLIQRVFRAVDRGNYYMPDHKQSAYKDIAWRMGNLHLSAPCVYSVVLESLKLKPGLSFLNIGSGTGYLSTMAGLILGTYGVNHGIELYSDIVDFAHERLEEFLKNSSAIDQYDFCEPTFTVGNCLSLDNPCQQYDRVYCGASCPADYEPHIKNFVKIGGILVMPLNEKLLKMTRTSDSVWHTVKVLSVSFASLVSPGIKESSPSASVEQHTSNETYDSGHLVPHFRPNDTHPPKLQNICRSFIRSILRNHINCEHPHLEMKLRKKDKHPIRQVRRIVIPFYDHNDVSASHSNSDADYESDGAEYTISSRLPSRMSIFLEDFLRRHAELQLLRDMHIQHSDAETQLKPAAEEAVSLPCDEEDVANMDCDDQSSEMISLITVSNEGHSSGDDSSNLSKPPSQSTRSRRKRNLKRKHSDSEGTSSETTPKQKKKVKRTSTTVVWKKIVDVRDGQDDASSTATTQPQEENYSDFMVEKIGALPLPLLLLRYLNYRRQNL